ncbi:hypothetical protein GCM10023232_08940 [Sphingosinicella ginsenosidimutans]|uniref:Uncharacterized protein n=1 Tax=Allosphingosinicella ginsenosidimutans TaxID=1176539 RepID=A0A5C6TWD4_9SPHN|nr:hypothetical protein [Sphingosinicella ginsenosidimutans]TXC64702.1 hypothetical protein FRZ32_14215 [Sphingosinicella ginsenosidimutans]
MARRTSSRSYGRSYYDSSRSIGLERALEHIEAARRLSAELGGTDKDVKAYFFALPPRQMESLLDAYGRRYGSSARDYATATLRKWRSGEVQMSGLVAERLFNLLPPRMPLTEKYKLTEGLWEHFGPTSKKRLRIGVDADVGEAVEAVRAHFDTVILHHKIPPQLEQRFNWLAAGDVEVKQQLLNYLRDRERSLLSEGTRIQLPVMIEHIKADAAKLTSRMSQTLKIGKHELELLVDGNANGVRLEDWSPLVQPRTTSSGTVGFWIVVGLIVLYLISKYSH